MPRQKCSGFPHPLAFCGPQLPHPQEASGLHLAQGQPTKGGKTPNIQAPLFTFVLPATNMRINQGVTAMVLRRPSSSAHSRYRTSDLVSKVTLTAAGLRPSPGLQVPTLTGTQ